MKERLREQNKICFLKNYRYETLLFMMFLLTYLFQAPGINDLNPFTAIYYVLSYADFGFKSRLVLGSFIRIFTDYVSAGFVYGLMHLLSIAFIGTVAVVLARTARRIEKNSGINTELLILVFVASPVFIQYLFNINNFGRLDLFSVWLAVAIFCCIHHQKAKWLIPVLCGFAVLLNYNFVVMYFPVLAVALFYEFAVKSKAKVLLLILIASGLLCVGLFVYFKALATPAGFADTEELKVYLAKITDIQGGELPAYGDFCIPLSGIYTRDISEAYSWFFDLLRVYGPFMLFSSAPAFVVIAAFWLVAFRKARVKIKKFIWLLCLFVPLAGAPMFLAIDWDRWIPILFLSQCMLVVYMLVVNDEDAVAALTSIKTYFEKHLLVFAIMVIYLASSVFSNNYSVYLSVMLNHIDKFIGFADIVQ